MAQFSVTVNAQVNQPPTSVGDGSSTTDYGVTIVFTRNDFTTLTIPAYSDPEGDAAENLRILTLPSQGELQLNGVAIVAVNTVVSFADIDSGLFTFVPNAGNTSSYVDPFTFEISDTGSGSYTS